MATVEPLRRRVWVYPDDQQATLGKAARVLVAERYRPAATRGTVVLLGPDCDAAQLAVGDTVLFKQYAGEKVEQGGEVYLVLEWDDVLAVVGRAA